MLESRLSLISQQVMSSINQIFMSVIWLWLLSKKINSTFFLEIPTREKTLPNISTKKNWFANFVWNIWNLFKNLFKVQWFSWWNDGKKDKSYSKAGVWCDSGVTVVWQLFKLSILINQCFFTFTFQMIPELRTILYGANPNRKFMD